MNIPNPTNAGAPASRPSVPPELSREIDIVIPVYRGREDTARCLESVAASLIHGGARIVLVDDASPEPGLSDWLAEWVAAFAQTRPDVVLLKNATNRGFVASVNRGMALASDRDVILLNNDTEVAGDWYRRLAAHAEADPSVGTVTPFSNNATICSFPVTCHENPLLHGMATASLDRLFVRVHPGRSIPVPTAVGFCMFIRRACLAETGVFDEEAFGRGYGEENDFCMRAAAKGWRHVLAADTFVRHEGGVSFGPEREEHQARALRILEKRHPRYLHLVRRHLQEDPAAGFRAAVRLEAAREDARPKILMVSHDISGGCEQHIRELVAWFQNRVAAPVLRFLDNGDARLEVGSDGVEESLYFPMPRRYPELVRVCRYLGVERVHFHYIRERDVLLRHLPAALRVPYDVTLHDYALIAGNPTLTDRRGRFVEEPPVMAAWARDFLAGADRVIAPSAYTTEMYRRAFPGRDFLAAWHPDGETARYPDPARPARTENRPFRVLVLGALNREKGADLLESCARDSRCRNIEFHLVGFAYRRLRPPVTVHGSYRNEDLPGLIAGLDPDIVWFPARCPETWSYTLSAALESGRPIAVPDFGAFPERLEDRPLTWLRPHADGVDEWASFLAGLAASPIPFPKTMSWERRPAPPAGAFYADAYLRPGTPAEPCPSFHPDPASLAVLVRREGRRTPRETILVWLLKIRLHPVAGRLLDWIPYDVQRRIKRWFSRSPIHELIRPS